MNTGEGAGTGDMTGEISRLKMELAEQFMKMERLEAHISAENRSPTNIETMKLADYRAAIDEARERIVELEGQPDP